MSSDYDRRTADYYTVVSFLNEKVVKITSIYTIDIPDDMMLSLFSCACGASIAEFIDSLIA